MFDFFNKKSVRNIEKSEGKYTEVLKEDINLIIRTRFNEKAYNLYKDHLMIGQYE